MLRRALILALFALGGCALLPKSEPEPVAPLVIESSVPEDLRQVADLIGYAQRYAQMNAEEQKRELNAAAASQTRDKTTYARVRLALLLSTPGSAGQDDARAASLLEPYAVAPQTGSLRQFANLLNVQLNERARQSKRADQYKDQLEALRAIERSFIDRGLELQPRKP